MIFGRYDEGGGPRVRCQLRMLGNYSLQGKEIVADIDFLVDTGADRTAIMPSATAKAGIDCTKLGEASGMTRGVGGSVRPYVCGVAVIFAQLTPAKVLYVYVPED